MSRIERNRAVFITGLSGAGISSCLKTLEDLGFEVFDNFLLTLVAALLNDPDSRGRPVAIGIDSRARGFSADSFLSAAEKQAAQIVFLTCDTDVLQRRFTETRRRHPLADDGSVGTGIQKERALFAPIQDRAALTIDTSGLSIHDLRHILKGHFGIEGALTLNITLMSFGFRYGPPREADIVMDVRFLQNPHWVPALKPKTGKDAAVGSYIAQDPVFETFLTRLKDLLDTVLPRYAEEGKSYLTIAIGCTGGKHRSVFTVETLQTWLRDKGYQPHTEHRDLGK